MAVGLLSATTFMRRFLIVLPIVILATAFATEALVYWFGVNVTIRVNGYEG
jgi:hypothetical protein